MACEAASGLTHWHRHGPGGAFGDVAARSFLVTADLSVVLGRYGTESTAHQRDYVVLEPHRNPGNAPIFKGFNFKESRTQSHPIQSFQSD